MSTERNELISRIMFAFSSVDDAYALEKLADWVEASYIRKPRVVTTAEELDALPEGSLLLASGTYYGYGTFTDCHVRIVPEFITGTESRVLEVLIYGGSDLAKSIDFPATVLHEGAQS